MKPTRLSAILLIFIIFLLGNVSAAEANSEWATLKTDYFTVFYHPGREIEALEALQTLEQYRPKAEQISGGRKGRLNVVLDDTGTMINGYSDPLGNNVHLYRYQPAEWAGAENWWALVGVHEYLHHLTLAQNSGWPKAYQKLFGSNLLAMPNLANPGWITEGITVYGESQLSPYQGRLNAGGYEAYIAARAGAGEPASLLAATHETDDFHLDGIYTYGGEFFGYLARKYGEAKFAAFFKAGGASWDLFSPFPAQGIDRNALRVYGKTFPQLWREWWDYEGLRVKNYPGEGERVTNWGWHVQYPLLHGAKLYYQRRYPVKTGVYSGYWFHEIWERDTKSGRERKVVTSAAPFSGPLGSNGGQLYYMVNEQKPGYANAANLSFGYYSVLHRLDLATGKDRVILEGHLRTFAVLPGGNILYVKDRTGGFGTVVCRFEPQSGATKTLLDSDYLIAEIAADDTRIVVSARRDGHNLSLYQLDLGKKELLPLVDTPYLEMNPQLQGEKLYFAANYDQLVSSYCYDLKTGQVSSLTRNNYAAMAVGDAAGQELYFVGLGVAGYDLYRKPLQEVAFQLPEATPFVAPPVENTPFAVVNGDYRDNLKTLTPHYWWPFLNRDGAMTEYGAIIGGSDAVGDFPAYRASVYYNSARQHWGSNFYLNCNYWAPLQAVLSYENPADDADTTWSLNLLYPAVNKLAAGLATVAAGTQVNRDSDYEGLELVPFLQLKLQYPKTRVDLEVRAPYSELRSGARRSGLYTKFSWRQYLPGSELLLTLKNMVDPNNPDPVFPKLRGYDTELGAKSGQIYAAEYERPVWKIHRGCWNPNLYFGDLVAKVFYEQAVTSDDERQAAYGLELHLETKVHPASIPLDWGVRYVRNEQQETRYELLLNLWM